MEKMERELIVTATERKHWTKDTQKLGGWISFVWSGSLLGILGELIISNSFHNDLKEDNIVGSCITKDEPFSYIWKAIDFGGAGTASSESDFMQAMYTPHYGPLKRLNQSNTFSNHAWGHDIISLAHIVRNLVSFMTSTTKSKTPYSGIDNKERFLSTPNMKRLQLTNRIQDEMKQLCRNHHGVRWCMKWVNELHSKQFQVVTWWIDMAQEWLLILDKASDIKPKMWNRIPIQPRIKQLLRLLKRLK